MATIQEKILEEFYRKLAQSEGFTEVKVKQVRELLGGGKKPKAADVLKVFSEDSKEKLS